MTGGPGPESGGRDSSPDGGPVVVHLGSTTRAGRVVDLSDRDLDPEAVARAVRSDGSDSDRGSTLRVACPTPGRVHDHVGCLGPSTTLRVRTALAAAARSRGHVAPEDDRIESVRDRLDEVEAPTPPDLEEARERLAGTETAVEECRERVAALRGRVQAGREAGRDVSDAEAALREAQRELTERETERAAAREALDRARRQGKLTPSLLNGLYVKLSDFLSGKPVARPGDFGAERLIRSSLGRVEQAGKPFVLFNNFIDAHGPMENLRCLDSDVDAAWTSTALSDDELRDAPEEYEDDLENYRELYAANVEYLDEKVAEYVEALQARTDGETTVIVTADHGDELLLDRERDVGHSDFSNALLHVPFVVINAEGEDVTEPTTLLDVDRIVHSLVEDGTVPDVTRDLVPAERLGMLFYDGNDEYWRRAVRTVYQDDGRYEWDSLGEEAWLEVSTSADGERTETEIPDRIRAQFDSDLHAYLDEQRASATTVDVSRETENRLENLGYKV